MRYKTKDSIIKGVRAECDPLEKSRLDERALEECELQCMESVWTWYGKACAEGTRLGRCTLKGARGEALPSLKKKRWKWWCSKGAQSLCCVTFAPFKDIFHVLR